MSALREALRTAMREQVKIASQCSASWRMATHWQHLTLHQSGSAATQCSAAWRLASAWQHRPLRELPAAPSPAG